jgi:hypothetical protein
MIAKKKRGLPNQHGRLPRHLSFGMRTAFGSCPACGSSARGIAVIYRRSWRSITFKCKACALQWTITHANMHRAAKTQAEIWRGREHEHAADIGSLYEDIAAATQENADHEAKRRNTITRQTKRRVIRLGNGEC